MAGDMMSMFQDRFITHGVFQAYLSKDDKENYASFAEDLTRVRAQLEGNRASSANEKRAKRLEKAVRKKALTKQRGAARDFKTWEGGAEEYTSQVERIEPIEPVMRKDSSGKGRIIQIATITAAQVHANPECFSARSNPWACDEDTPEWVLVEEEDTDEDTEEDVIPDQETSDETVDVEQHQGGVGPLDYCPAPLDEFVVPSRAKLRQERWELL